MIAIPILASRDLPKLLSLTGLLLRSTSGADSAVQAG